MKEESNPKTYFWPYDLFGYLLPGFVVVICLIECNQHVREIFVARFQTKEFMDIAVLIGIAYIVGHLVAALSSLLLEHVLLKNTAGFPSAQLFAEKTNHSFFTRLLLGLIPGRTSPYRSEAKERTKNLFKTVFGYEPAIPPGKIDQGELYWLISNYVAEHNASGFRSATHFLELYGFSRNTSMSLFLVAFLPFFHGWTPTLPANVHIPKDIPLAWVWFAGFFAMGLLMYINYGRLLVRKNDQLFRAFIVSASEAESTDQLNGESSKTMEREAAKTVS